MGWVMQRRGSSWWPSIRVKASQKRGEIFRVTGIVTTGGEIIVVTTGIIDLKIIETIVMTVTIAMATTDMTTMKTGTMTGSITRTGTTTAMIIDGTIIEIIVEDTTAIIVEDTTTATIVVDTTTAIVGEDTTATVGEDTTTAKIGEDITTVMTTGITIGVMTAQGTGMKTVMSDPMMGMEIVVEIRGVRTITTAVMTVILHTIRIISINSIIGVKITTTSSSLMVLNMDINNNMHIHNSNSGSKVRVQLNLNINLPNIPKCSSSSIPTNSSSSTLSLINLLVSRVMAMDNSNRNHLKDRLTSSRVWGQD